MNQAPTAGRGDRLAQRVALVTGAGRGIGRSVATRLAREGAAVVVNDIDPATARAAVAEITAAGGRAVAAPLNVSLEADVARLVAEAVQTFGRLDILVNNAGVDAISPIAGTAHETWRKVLSVDLDGAFFCAKHAAPHLVAQRGAIVNIASIHAFVTQPDRAAYASAKAGLVGLTKALAVELGPRGVRANAILPGYIQTEIWDEWLNRTPSRDETIRRISDQHPLRRIGSPADIAGAVAFLVSDEAQFISGTTLVVDGGLTATYVPPPL